jgi:hypothetical protein
LDGKDRLIEERRQRIEKPRPEVVELQPKPAKEAANLTELDAIVGHVSPESMEKRQCNLPDYPDSVEPSRSDHVNYPPQEQG